MAVISFDRVNRYVIVGYLTNQFTTTQAESSELLGVHSHGGHLTLTNQGLDDGHGHMLARIWYPVASGNYLEQEDFIDVIEGETYTLSYYVNGHGAQTAMYQGEIEWYNGAGEEIGTSWSPIVDINGLGWIRFTMTDIAPMGASYALIELYARSPYIQSYQQVIPGEPDDMDDVFTDFPNADHIIFDNAQFEVGSVASAWHSPDDTDTSVTIQELYDAIIDFQDDSANLNMEQICSAEGKADLGGGKLTVVTLKMLNDWKVKFTDRFNEPTTLCTVEDGNFVGDGYFPLESSEYVFSVISQATTGALVPGQNASDDGTAAAVWGEDLSTYTVAGSAGDVLREIVANAASAVWDEALASHLIAGSTGEKLDALSSSGGDGGHPPGLDGSSVNPAQIADAVWNEPLAEHTTPGSAGDKLSDAGAAGDPGAIWEEPLADHSTPGTFGSFMKKLLTLAKFLGLKDS